MATAKGTETLVAKRKAESLAGTERLMEEVCELENCKQALQRVKANKGSPGIDGMKVGDLTEVLRTPRGYQILKLESRTETKIKGFDDARDEISRKVAEQKSRGEMQKYLDKLRAEATITWRNDELDRRRAR